MAISVLKPTVITAAGLGVLERELVVPRLVWQNPIGSFAGALNDTVSIRVPAYATARTRALRSGTARTRDSLTDRKVDVSLTTDVYKDVRITDEELTLDISDFGAQVLNPVMSGIARKMEDAIVTTITSASYALTITGLTSSNNFYKDMAVVARRKLNDAQVPQEGRVLLVGSAIEAALLSTDQLVKVNESGSDSALRNASIGRIAGFDIVISNAIPVGEAYAFHRSAFVMSTAAPVVPAGAPFGSSQSYGGFAMRVVRVLDSATIEDILAVDAWVGSSAVTDEGFVNSSGQFEPSEGAVGASTTVTGVAATDLFTATAHGLAAGDAITFTSKTGGAGVTLGQKYYVIASGLTANDFKVSATLGGSTIDLTSDMTATSTYRKNGAASLVRAVKIVSNLT